MNQNPEFTLWLAGGLIFVMLLFLGISALISSAKKAEVLHNERLATAKRQYDLSLDNLTTNPSDPSARVRCLELGRIHYEMTIPDTYTVNGNGARIASQNNSANREARIQSDIEARVGHLKMAG
jgi:hypothetical protein